MNGTGFDEEGRRNQKRVTDMESKRRKKERKKKITIKKNNFNNGKGKGDLSVSLIGWKEGRSMSLRSTDILWGTSTVVLRATLSG